MFGFQTSQEDDEVGVDDAIEATFLAKRDLEALKKLKQAVDGFKKLGTWQRRVDELGERRDLIALSLVYDLYVDYREDSEGWKGFLAGLDLTLARQTKYPVSPFLG